MSSNKRCPSSCHLCRRRTFTVQNVHGISKRFFGFFAVLSFATSCSLELSLSSLHLSPVYAPNEALKRVTVTSLLDCQHHSILRSFPVQHRVDGVRSRARRKWVRAQRSPHIRGQRGSSEICEPYVVPPHLLNTCMAYASSTAILGF